MSTRARALIIDDDPDVGGSLRLLLEARGVTVQVETRPERAAQSAQEFAPDLVLCDLRMPRIDGQGVVQLLRAQGLKGRLVVMSAFGSLDTARAAIGWGADDYVSKPIRGEDLDRLLAEIAMCKAHGPVVAQFAPAAARFGRLVGTSPAMRQVYRTIERIAPFPTTVLIRGESGVGKELVAREIHDRSPRAAAPFVAVNCGAIPETLLESELFGYSRGAFTGAERDHPGLIREAHKGTLFLDEIGDLPPTLQVKLLRVIQESVVQPLGGGRPVPVDVRWITATLRDIAADVAAGRFRQDLYFRINVMELELPPLRERRGDLRLLASEFLAQLGERYGNGVREIEAEAVAVLEQHGWPGNVRELENVLERACILSNGDVITAEGVRGLVGTSGASQSQSAHDVLPLESLSIKRESQRLEELLIRRALERTKGNRTQAARILEISHRALLYKMKEFGIEV